MKLSILFLSIFFQFSLSAANAQKVNITTFNIKWFGLGGSMWNSPETEFRQQYIKRFLDQELPSSNIIVFVEVTNPELLSKIVADRFDCVTYARDSIRHQRIVTCYNPGKYRVEKYDEDYIIPEVALDNPGLRPATQVKICSLNGKCFLQLIGVHLAAGPKTEKRVEQMNLIAENLKKQTKILPTVITGDFNSYSTHQNGLAEDDMSLFEKTLSSTNTSFKSITRSINTYNTGERGRAYDHIVISSDITYSRVTGYKACEKNPNLNEKFIPYYSFSRYFSDHCPVTAQLTIR